MKRLIKSVLLLAFWAVMAALLLELGLRIVGISYPNFYLPDNVTGFAHRPGAEGWWRKEGEAYIRINSDGLRDREHTKAKPPDVVRVAVLGDSMIEALQVPLENTACAVLEAKLQHCDAFAGKKVEVINFGVSSYGTAQELLMLRQKVWDYSPDVVILAVTTANDINDNSPSLAQDPDLRAYFVHRDGQLVADTSFLNSERFRRQQSLWGRFLIGLKNHSRLVQIANELRSAFLNRKGSQNEKIVEAYHLVYREPEDQTWTEAWSVTEGVMSLMSDEVKQKGAKFFVVTLTNDWQVYPDAAARADFAKEMNVPDLFYPDRRIKALGDHGGFAVLNLAPILQVYAEQNKVFLHGFKPRMGFGHWNIEGNKLAGETIARFLCEQRYQAVVTRSN